MLLAAVKTLVSPIEMKSGQMLDQDSDGNIQMGLMHVKRESKKEDMHASAYQS